MFWGSMVITAGMLLLALHVTLRPRGPAAAASSLRWVVGGGLVFPGMVLLALMLYGFGPGRASLPQDAGGDAYRVDVVAHQWWWEVMYPDIDGAPLLDANEIHVPVGRPVHVVVTSADVIHSFWVPRLGGKIDAIPGHRNRVVLQAEAPGIYRGQCSEFCGAQHARMGFQVEAHEARALEERLQRLAGRSRPPPGAETDPGAADFARHCAACHSIDARSRSALPGPNLAGLADRNRLGAGWLGNDREARRRWLSEHQSLKPGNRMPDFAHLDDRVLDGIADFLERRD
jgi:cytochrome c oxidase subunit 2